MKILVLNAGSSSIKYQLFEMPNRTVLASGLVEKIGEECGNIKHQLHVDGVGDKVLKTSQQIVDHESGMELIVKLLLDEKYGPIKQQEEIEAVGHRVVHGGEEFSKPTEIMNGVLERLEALSHLAPLHNPANIKGIEVSSKIFQDAKQVAVFDTAFHQSMPDYAFRFAIPNSYYKDHGLRAFGFHGTSHQYVSKKAADFLKIPGNGFTGITIHLGNGCSMAAIKNGKCVDTSMGLTPLGGLMMGTRSGDIDPSLVLYLSANLGMSTEEIDKLLNKQSGLKGLTGDNDLRNVLARYDSNDPEARIAIEMYVYRIRKYLGSYAAILGKIDAIVFTAGVGENSWIIRELVCKDLDILGIQLDPVKNKERNEGIDTIESAESNAKILVVPTNEELEIANQTFELLNS